MVVVRRRDQYRVDQVGIKKLFEVEEARKIGVQVVPRRLEPTRLNIAYRGKGRSPHLLA